MKQAIADLLAAAGMEGIREDMGRTPERAARAWRDHLLAGYGASPARILEPLKSSRGRDVVAVRDIPFISTCPHHLLPFHGMVHLAYHPDGAVVGISRLAALVHCLSRRLQIQEDLTSQLARELHAGTASLGAACVVQATHLCMTGRRGETAGSLVTTASFEGCYETDARQRSQVLGLLGFGRPAGGGLTLAGGRRARRGR
jgi:GTP cyclohydrolase I